MFWEFRLSEKYRQTALRALYVSLNGPEMLKDGSLVMKTNQFKQQNSKASKLYRLWRWYTYDNTKQTCQIPWNIFQELLTYVKYTSFLLLL